MPFVINVNKRDRIVEVIYPAEPTSLEVADYILKIKRVMDEIEPPWCCLVDQRQLRMMSEKLVDQVRNMNQYAVQKGMIRSARIVAGSIGALQVSRVADGGLDVRSFFSREDALTWLKSRP